MALPRTRRGHVTASHTVWDATLEPVAVVSSGDEVEVVTQEASGGGIRPESTAADIATLDLRRVNPVTGPFAVEGARPGDALVVDLLSVDLDTWGWTALIPGFGLLADEFPEPYLRTSAVDSTPGGGGVQVLPDVVLPLSPMVGTIGVAPPEPGPHSVVPPRRWGGNMDIRDVGPGARVVLPVGVEGALFSLGDVHATMGDGEVCGTGVETTALVRVRLTVAPGRAPASPVVITDQRSFRLETAVATTGIGPDLYEGARDAVRQAVDLLSDERGISREDAYLLLSLAADLKISEVVDAPHWVVTCHVPRRLLPGWPHV
ncbi:acetamidase/formamidase family protein [Pseudokineococcus sp. 1T1Z-3]|uniref:acetamidase/formamidase family protein n=1 Tax=Pseudokineococcus sp. 1T1Z-3 TaxID=3132745 RepID=UPI0030B5D793